jgi:DNA adenine methylase
MYRCVAWHVEGVIARLERYRTQHSEAHYYATRSRWNDRKRRQSEVQRAATFIYLNKTCYNGLWRVNKTGLFNVPMGRYASPTILAPEALRAASRTLQRAELRNGSYVDAVAEAGRDDFVYLDPPYQPLSATANFTSYTADVFAETEQRTLAELARDLRNRGCSVMVSNHDTPLIRRLYRDFRLTAVRCSRAINSKADARGAVDELIITSS